MKRILILVVGFLLSASLLNSTVLAMTKSELIEAIAKESGMSKENTTVVIDSFFDVTTEILEEEGRLLIGFNEMSRMRLYFSYSFLNEMGLVLGAHRGDSIMCIVNENIIGKEVRFGDGILGRMPPG